MDIVCEPKLATMDDAVREWAWNVGATVPHISMLTSPFDTKVRNPHYRGAVAPEYPPVPYVDEDIPF